MAGNYNDAPSRRMAWDADGTVAMYHPTTGALVAWNSTQKTELNDEDNVKVYNAPTGKTVWLFPELREIDGIFAAKYYNNNVLPNYGAVDSSGNTTNGIDGTWVQQLATMPDVRSCYDKFRDNIESMAVATESGLRIGWTGSNDSNNGMMAVHIYGTISPGETPDRILFLDTENSDAVFTKVLDYAEVPRGQTQSRTIKLKNNSASKTINTIQITAESPYLNAGSWFTFGDDDVSYQATYAVGNLGSAATQLIYVKQNVPDGETLGLQTGRFKVSHASLT
jgi:hypothetical protein